MPRPSAVGNCGGEARERCSPGQGPPPRPGENREPGWSQAPRPEAPHSPARPRRIPSFLPPPHACPHGRVHPLTSRRQPRLRLPGTPEGRAGHGGGRVCREWCLGRCLSFVARPEDRRTFSSSVPRTSPLLARSSLRGGAVGERPLPCSPQKEAASARSQLRRQGCLPPSLLPFPHLSLPFPLGPQSFLPALTSSQDGCPGPAASRGRHCLVPVPGLGAGQWGSALPASLEASLHSQTPELLPLSPGLGEGQCRTSGMEAAARVSPLGAAAWPLAPGGARDGGTLGFSWALFR